jgi:hypothetical protein
MKVVRVLQAEDGLGSCVDDIKREVRGLRGRRARVRLRAEAPRTRSGLPPEGMQARQHRQPVRHVGP